MPEAQWEDVRLPLPLPHCVAEALPEAPREGVRLPVAHTEMLCVGVVEADTEALSERVLMGQREGDTVYVPLWLAVGGLR